MLEALRENDEDRRKRMAFNDGGAAFPLRGGQYFASVNSGMSLRDYFAAAALTGRAESFSMKEEFPILARESYAIADAMLAERTKEKND